ncbi:MAG TPA: hypothetical protein VMU95_00400 [Trebonia sp.]|nr:hypothetical protein [Trebonia sp.]
MMPDQAQTQGPRTPSPVRRLTRPAVALAGVILFQLLFAGVFVGVLHHPVLHQAPVAVAGHSPLAQVVSARGGGTVRLVSEPTAVMARAALTSGRVNAAVIAGPEGDSLLIQTAASPGPATVLTKEFTAAAAALKTPLRVRDLAPLPPADSAGTALYFLVTAWMLGGYVGATALAMVTGGMRSPGLRQAAVRLGLLAGYAVVSGLLGALLIGPWIGVVSGYSLSLAATGVLLVFGAAAATAGLQAALGVAGTLISVVGMVVFGDPTAGTSIATPLLASPWNVIGKGLPPSAALSVARGVVYLGGANLTGPLIVLASYAGAGILLTLAATGWPRRRSVSRAPRRAAPVAGTAAVGGLGS